jgi:hypothetical protein
MDGERLVRFDGTKSSLLAVHQFILLLESCTITTRLAHESKIALSLCGVLRERTLITMPDGQELIYEAGDHLGFDPEFAFSSRASAREDDGSCTWCGAPEHWRRLLPQVPRP